MMEKVPGLMNLLKKRHGRINPHRKTAGFLIFAKDGPINLLVRELLSAAVSSPIPGRAVQAANRRGIVPFGDYSAAEAEKRHLVRGNIIPVPDARFPFPGGSFHAEDER
ncbi:hypothetical protein BV898_16216 [Hypsibius exemplaris]|uniref:Uncharacterized protein n=1 Tax=Hypsibius exemplaris TaxID=2072580 RepID=A0A9X6NJT9_HYPEX|nr:hypothetical protein BV898_16216 [Hypsibius exemplaris]